MAAISCRNVCWDGIISGCPCTSWRRVVRSSGYARSHRVDLAGITRVYVYSGGRAVCSKNPGRSILEQYADHHRLGGPKGRRQARLISGEVRIRYSTCSWSWLLHHIYMDFLKRSTTIMGPSVSDASKLPSRKRPHLKVPKFQIQ